MSMNKHATLLLGIQIKASEFDIISDRIYELDETEDSLLDWRFGEGSDYVYIGKILEESEPYTDEIHVNITALLKDQDIDELRNKLYNLLNWNITLTNIKLWFFDWWG